MTQCKGKNRAGVLGGLVQCDRDTFLDDYCYFCSKVAGGLITTTDSKPGHDLAWKPTEGARNPGGQALADAMDAHVERLQLLNEWDDATNVMATSLLG